MPGCERIRIPHKTVLALLQCARTHIPTSHAPREQTWSSVTCVHVRLGQTDSTVQQVGPSLGEEPVGPAGALPAACSSCCARAECSWMQQRESTATRAAEHGRPGKRMPAVGAMSGCRCLFELGSEILCRLVHGINFINEPFSLARAPARCKHTALAHGWRVYSTALSVEI